MLVCKDKSVIPVGGFWGLSGAGQGQCPLAPPLPGRVSVGMSSGSTTHTQHCQHRNYCRHKENTNKDHTPLREAGISQQKRRIETLKAAFISLRRSVHGLSNCRNARAWGTLQVTRISSFIAYLLYKLATNTGVFILFALFGPSETEWDLFSFSEGLQ